MPNDEELQKMTGVTDIDASAIFDHHCLESWQKAGFSRDEAFALLLTMKGTSRYIHMMPEHPDGNS